MPERVKAGVQVSFVTALALGVAPAAGCAGSSMQATARQPNPLVGSMQSERLYINVRDAELPRYVLRNTAFFHVVSRDRLRFHITLVHKWQEMTDVSGWRAYLEDDRGRRYRPEAKEVRYVRHLTRMTDVDKRSTYRVNPEDYQSDIIRVNDDGYLRRVPLASVDVFRGEGDLVFSSHDILRRDVRSLTLVLQRAGTELRYVWEFSDQGPVIVQHYGVRLPRPGPAGIDDGLVILPGPLTGNR